MTARHYACLARYVLGQWPLLLLTVALTMATSAVAVLLPWPVKLLVDYALGSADLPGWLGSSASALGLSLTPAALVLLAAAASMAIFLLTGLLDVGVTMASSAAGQRMVVDLAAALYGRLLALSPSYHSRRHVGDLLSRVTGDVYCVYTLSGCMLAPLGHLTTLAMIGVIAWGLDPQLTLIALAAAPVMSGAALALGPLLKRRATQGRERHAQLMSMTQQTLASVALVQAFGTEDRNRSVFRSIAAGAVAVAQRGALIDGAYGSINGLVTTAGTAAVLYVGGLRVLDGALSVGSLLVFLAYLHALQGAFAGLLDTYARLKAAEASADRVFEVLDEGDRVEEAPGARPLPHGVARGHLRLEQVSFAYTPGRPVLHDVTLDIQPGERVALVGPTGAGKSTLAALIPRLFDPTAGRVLLDGHDVRTLTLASVRAQVGLVLQEPLLLPLSVAENIAYGRPGATRAEVEAAARAAQADEFIRELPAGYETVLGERGATLSGGQRQRLAVARALLKDAPVLVLDEPTAALDVETEAELLEALERLMAGRTVVVIAHRLSTVRRADRIVVLDGGRVVEVGTHQQLLAHGGLYARLCRRQAAPTLEEQPA